MSVNIVKRITTLGKAVSKPALEMPGVAFKITSKAASQQMANIMGFGKNSFDHIKSVPSIRSMDDATNIATAAGNNAIQYTKDTLNVVKESTDECKKWLDYSLEHVQAAMNVEEVIEAEEKKTTAKSTTAKKAAA